MADLTTSQPAPFVKAPTSLREVCLFTSHGTAMVNFYLTFLGGIVDFSSGVSIITFGDRSTFITILQATPNPQPKDPALPIETVPGPGTHKLNFWYDDLGDLMDAYRQRKELGIVPVFARNLGTITTLTYVDPEGNEVGLKTDHLSPLEGVDPFGHRKTKACTSGPYRILDFDPEEVLQCLEREKGVEIHGEK